MFGLGLWECVGIIMLAMLVFGPRMFVRLGSSVWKSLTGFVNSFQQARAEVDVLDAPQPAALKSGQESGGTSS
jgi:Sec-independent protein translocase protein TatA